MRLLVLSSPLVLVACANLSGLVDLERVDCLDCAVGVDGEGPDLGGPEVELDAAIDTTAPDTTAIDSPLPDLAEDDAEDDVLTADVEEAEVDGDGTETPEGDDGALADACPDANLLTDRDNCGSCGRRCAAGVECTAGRCVERPSCAAIRALEPTAPSGAYTIDPDGDGPIAPFAVYCDMVESSGGWTLALKLDGAKKTFAYSAAIWTDTTTLAEDSTDLERVEAKFPSYSTMPFTQLRVVMGSDRLRGIVLPLTGGSLRARFAAASVTTSLGRGAWLGLLSNGILQANCNREGTNLELGQVKLRLGILGNNEPNCNSPDSYLGFGAEYPTWSSCYASDPAATVGNAASTMCGASADRATQGFGYIFLR
jgi:hypothetical protein